MSSDGAPMDRGAKAQPSEPDLPERHDEDRSGANIGDWWENRRPGARKKLLRHGKRHSDGDYYRRVPDREMQVLRGRYGK